jgi:hypothetical protein
VSHGYNKIPTAVDALNRADTDPTAVLFSKRDAPANAAARRLGRDLVATGSTVIVVGDADAAAAIDIRSPVTHTSAKVAHRAVITGKIAQFNHTLCMRPSDPMN